MAKQLFIGVMSGTSLDGIDTVLASFSGSEITTINSHSTEFTPQLRNELYSLCQPGPNEIERSCKASIDLAMAIADNIQILLHKSKTKPSSICAIGSHGQTIRHQPSSDKPFSLQIGDPSTIAQLTGITTISDFRMADIAAGGQGAPLVPAFHRAVFSSKTNTRIILNIGGIANISLLPATSARSMNISGYDTGPGNMLMDAWIQHSQQLPFDKNGKWAKSGKDIDALLKTLLDEPYLNLAPPKSTGRELFNLEWLQTKIANKDFPSEDIQKTLLEYTAQTISENIKSASKKTPCEVFVCGGGIENTALMERLQELLVNYKISSTQELGIHPQLVEASAFAWLAMRTHSRLPGNACEITGASREKILGGIYFA